MQSELENGLLVKEIKHASEVLDKASSLGKKAPILSENAKIDNLISELEKLKVRLV